MLKFSEMDTTIVMDIIFGMPITRQFVKKNGKPEQHQRSGVLGFFDFHGDNEEPLDRQINSRSYRFPVAPFHFTLTKLSEAL